MSTDRAVIPSIRETLELVDAAANRRYNLKSLRHLVGVMINGTFPDYHIDLSKRRYSVLANAIDNHVRTSNKSPYADWMGMVLPDNVSVSTKKEASEKKSSQNRSSENQLSETDEKVESFFANNPGMTRIPDGTELTVWTLAMIPSYNAWLKSNTVEPWTESDASITDFIRAKCILNASRIVDESMNVVLSECGGRHDGRKTPEELEIRREFEAEFNANLENIIKDFERRLQAEAPDGAEATEKQMSDCLEKAFEACGRLGFSSTDKENEVGNRMIDKLLANGSLPFLSSDDKTPSVQNT